MKRFFNFFYKIRTFEIVTLRTSGMQPTVEYEITNDGERAEVSQYAVEYRDGETTRRPERRAVCDKAAVIRLMNQCRLFAWDGFDGKHPKHVKDGTQFVLKATVNGGKEIHAKGSQNFPRHYHEFTDGLREILKNVEPF